MGRSERSESVLKIVNGFELDLDEQQYAAVVAPVDSPVLVLAGAGSGKTRVLTMRVVHLIKSGVRPESLVVTTFTRKAADELKERLVPLIGKEVAGSVMCNTIHGVCLAMLREEDMAREVISDYEKRKIIEEGLHTVNWDCGWRYPAYWISRLKAAVVDGLRAEQWLRQRLEQCGVSHWQAQDLAVKLAAVYRSYERDKGYVGKMDFDDMIFLTAKKLREDAAFKKKWQDRVETVLIDEAQDDMRLAVEILETVAEPENRVFMCADDMQELYGWNLADVAHNVFGFLERYPTAKMCKIETNYRSTKKIVAVSNRLVMRQYGPEREKFRKIVKPRPDAADGVDIVVVEAEDVYEEAGKVRDWMTDLLNDGKKPGDFFVLYRLNAQSRAIEDALIGAGIPYMILGSLGFYDRAVIKDVMSYVKLVEDKNDNEAFRRVANIASIWHEKHFRGFGGQFFAECGARHQSLWHGMLAIKQYQNKFKKSGIDDLEMFMRTLEKDGEHKPAKTIGMVREYSYDAWIRKREGVPEGHDVEGVFDDLEELMEASQRFETNADMLAYIEKLREAKKRQQAEGDANVVTLSTVHRAKGLESPCVAVVGVSDGILPHWRAVNPEQVVDQLPTDSESSVEDERCICFVAVSRAKERLLLSTIKTFRGRELTPSRFLGEMFGVEKKEKDVRVSDV